MDIAYCIKENGKNEELRYSLRSLINLPHDRVFIYGHIPKWVQNVVERPMVQRGANKWEKTADSLLRIANDKELSDEFILFNDDFFVMTPQTELPYYFDRTLEDRINDFRRKNMISAYTFRLGDAAKALKSKERPTVNYELHLPMVFNKEKFRKLWELYPGIGAKRSLYGNTYGIGGIQRPDCKIYETYARPNPNIDFLSTTDVSFKNGAVGKEIKRRFNTKSNYEQ